MKKDAIIDLIENDLNEMRRLVETFRAPDKIASAFIDLLSQKHESLGKEITLLKYWSSENIGGLGESELVAEVKAQPQKNTEYAQKRNPRNGRPDGETLTEKGECFLEVRHVKRELAFGSKQATPKNNGKENSDTDIVPDYFSEELENMADPLDFICVQHQKSPEAEAKVPSLNVTKANDETPHVGAITTSVPEIAEQVIVDGGTTAERTTVDTKTPFPTKASATDIANYGTPVADLFKAIGINDRFLYQRELFKGNKLAFDAAVETVNAAASYNQAYQYLRQSFGWDESDPTVEAFLKAVHRRFL